MEGKKGEYFTKPGDHPRKYPVIGASVTPKDKELLGWIQEYLGTSRSEAVRVCIRHFAAHIGFLERGKSS